MKKITVEGLMLFLVATPLLVCLWVFAGYLVYAILMGGSV